MNHKFKFGIIGLGRIGTRHAKCIFDHPNAELVAVCDVIEKTQWINDNQDVVFYSSLTDFLKHDLDVINICTPNYLHAQMAIQALNTKRHVVVEKPMALCTLDAKKIINTSIKNQKSIFGVMQNRFSPTVMWLKKIIDDHILGEINMVLVNCFWNRNASYYLDSNWHGSTVKDGGPLFTQFSHFIDIINWVFGDFSNISADFRSFKPMNYIEFEDTGFVRFNLKDPMSLKESICATLTYSTSIWNKNFESSITIIGQHGTIKIGGQYMDKVTYCDIENYIIPNLNLEIKCNDYGDYKGSASNHDKMIDAIINQLLLNNHSDFLSSEDGVNVVNIIERIYSLRN